MSNSIHIIHNYWSQGYFCHSGAATADYDRFSERFNMKRRDHQPARLQATIPVSVEHEQNNKEPHIIIPMLLLIVMIIPFSVPGCWVASRMAGQAGRRAAGRWQAGIQPASQPGSQRQQAYNNDDKK